MPRMRARSFSTATATARYPIRLLAAGIETVYQNLSLLPNLTVAENVALNEQLVASGGKLGRRFDRARLRRTAEAALATVGLPTAPAYLPHRLDRRAGPACQLVAIARAIATKAKMVIMDEPTTSLTRREVDTPSAWSSGCAPRTSLCCSSPTSSTRSATASAATPSSSATGSASARARSPTTPSTSSPS